MVFEWIPLLWGMMFGMLMVGEVVHDFPGGFLDPDVPPFLFAFFFSLVLGYVISSAVISGVPSTPLSVAILFLLWWSMYFTVLIFMGYQVFVI